MKYVIFDEASGRILSVRSSSFGVRVLGPGEQAIDDETHYIAGGALVARPGVSVADLTLPADGERHPVVTAPAGTKIQVNGKHVASATDDPVRFVPTSPGAYRFELTPPFPWRPASFTVTVVEV